MGMIFYGYLTKENEIIFKTCRYDNCLKVGEHNGYGHLLFYIGVEEKNNIVSVNSLYDYSLYRISRKQATERKRHNIKNIHKIIYRKTLKFINKHSGRWLYNE